MRDTFFWGRSPPPAGEGADFARFARLTLVGMSAGHQLPSLYSRLAD